MTNFKALSQAIQPHDYQPALQGALSWLGSRYLLAEPLIRRREAAVPDIFKADCNLILDPQLDEHPRP